MTQPTTSKLSPGNLQKICLRSAIFICKQSLVYKMVVSIILPVYNGEKWIEDCLESILKQTALSITKLEICIFNDGSMDNTSALLAVYEKKINKIPNLSLVVVNGQYPPKGVGYGRNRAVEASSGEFLCFQDIDDVMMPERIEKQLLVSKEYPNGIVGCKFLREPPNSTQRFTRWANNLPENLLKQQVLTSHGPTIIMPTWFCNRRVYENVGGFSEDGAGTPEDLIFFYRHLDLGGDVVRVDEQLLVYRHHPLATTFSISEDAIWCLRLERLQVKILPQWKKFTIWNAGKQGRKLWKCLTLENKAKVESFCDVDVKKCGSFYEPYIRYDRGTKTKIPIRHFRECRPPFVICVKMDLTGGDFERNLESLRLEEGRDFVMFS